MKIKAWTVKISNLSDIQAGHLAWYLDHKTYCGMLTAIRIAGGRYFDEDVTLFDVFKLLDFSDHQAKIHSKKVYDFYVGKHVPLNFITGKGRQNEKTTMFSV